MTIDTSALIAILFSEFDHLRLIDRILDADINRIGAPTLAETSLVYIGRLGRKRTSADAVGSVVEELGLTIVPFGELEWRRAADAFRRYGRGRHKAGLNFGDCLSYAAASTAGDSLLFVGDDFRLTDIEPAL